MQNDSKLEPSKRRNYKHAFDAMYRIAKYEGFFQLYTGFHMATIRGILVTIGKIFEIKISRISKIKLNYLRTISLLR